MALATKLAGVPRVAPACLDDVCAGGGKWPPPALSKNMLRLTYAPKHSGDSQMLPASNARAFYRRTLVLVDEVVEIVIADSTVQEIKAVDPVPAAPESLQIPK
jgi:hypothetical protein